MNDILALARNVCNWSIAAVSSVVALNGRNGWEADVALIAPFGHDEGMHVYWHRFCGECLGNLVNHKPVEKDKP